MAGIKEIIHLGFSVIINSWVQHN